MAETQPSPLPRGQRTGRRVAQVIYWGATVAISVTSAVTVTLQVFAAPPGPRVSSCAEGLGALSAAVDRARAAAAASEGSEDDALARFRAALEPDWAGVDGVAASCRGKPEDEGALDALERLRYAEEHAVRRESGELAPLRREVRRKVQAKVETSPLPSGPSSRP